jgi:hypothetical protein
MMMSLSYNDVNRYTMFATCEDDASGLYLANAQLRCKYFGGSAAGKSRRNLNCCIFATDVAARA